MTERMKKTLTTSHMTQIWVRYYQFIYRHNGILILPAPLDINQLDELDIDELNYARSDGILPAEFNNEQLAQCKGV
jgi:hypothetical protein